MYYKNFDAQAEDLQSQDNSLQSHDTESEFQKETELKVEYQALLQSFEVLAGITDPVRFPLEFEREQRRSGLRLSTFRQAYQPWLTQREGGAE